MKIFKTTKTEQPLFKIVVIDRKTGGRKDWRDEDENLYAVSRREADKAADWLNRNYSNKGKRGDEGRFYYAVERTA